MAQDTVYVSITGLKVKSVWSWPLFWWHAGRAKAQADKAPGLLKAQLGTVNGVQHTLTVWESEAAMRDFLHSGAHMEAIRAFRRIATGKTFGFPADSVPQWEEVHGLWLEHGRDY